MGIGFQLAAREAIETERRRQIAVEGWTAEHDDAHSDGELLRAAMCYYREAKGSNSYNDRGIPLSWPWDEKWWKPKGRARNLERAGALAIAERDRLKRANAPRHHVTCKISMIRNALARR